jgi:hypothetical protein
VGSSFSPAFFIPGPVSERAGKCRDRVRRGRENARIMLLQRSFFVGRADLEATLITGFLLATSSCL